MRKRIIAGLIDLGILQFCQIVIIIMQVEVTIYKTGSESELYDLLGFLMILVFSFIYLIIKDIVFWNKSIGKKIMGIHIISESTNERPLKRTIIIRNLTWLLFSLDILIFLIKGKRLGEIITNTKVVRNKNSV